MKLRPITLLGLSALGLGLAACTTISQAGTGNNLCANDAACTQGPAAGQDSPVKATAGGGTRPAAGATRSGVPSPAPSQAAVQVPSPVTDTAPPPKFPQYLAYINYADTNTANVGTGEGHIGKQVYPDTVYLCFDIENLSNINCDSSSAPYWVDYNVPAGYSDFSATLGYSDDSPSSCDAVVQIFGDGSQIYSRELYYGNVIPVSPAVGKYLRIRLEIIPKQGMNCVTDFGSAEFTAQS